MEKNQEQEEQPTAKLQWTTLHLSPSHELIGKAHLPPDVDSFKSLNKTYYRVNRVQEEKPLANDPTSSGVQKRENQEQEEQPTVKEAEDLRRNYEPYAEHLPALVPLQPVKIHLGNQVQEEKPLANDPTSSGVQKRANYIWPADEKESIRQDHCARPPPIMTAIHEDQEADNPRSIGITVGNWRALLKVPHQIRQVNENAYEPQLISIGPYHWGKPHLAEMEVYKQRLMSMMPPDIISKLKECVKANIDRARRCYSPEIEAAGDAEWETILLHDGCFTVILLCGRPILEIDPIFRLKWVLNTLYHDLLLLENQLPFFLLDALYNVLKDPREDGNNDLASQAFSVLSHFMPGPKKWVNKRNSTIRDAHNIKHLLSLVHDNWSPSPQGRKRHEEYYKKEKETEMEGEESTEEGDRDKCKFTLFAVEKTKGKKLPIDEEAGLTESTVQNKLNWKLICCKREKKNTRNGLVEKQSIGCATELKEAGIEFSKCSQGSNVESLFDISFTATTMQIPTFVIGDYTERLFRNLIAMELYEEGSTYVTDYVTLMDNLINSADDVKLLRINGIIVNLLGDDQTVAEMINKLRDHVTLCGDSFYYEETFFALKNHCGRRRNIWMAKLRHDYFNGPWALISFLAALLVILLTIGQFVTGLLQLF